MPVDFDANGADGLFVTSSCDETSHFDSVEADVEEIFDRIAEAQD